MTVKHTAKNKPDAVIVLPVNFRLISMVAYTPVFTSLVLVVWGFFVLLPMESFGAPAYAAFLEMAPESVWGISVALFGFASLFSLTNLGRSHLFTMLSWVPCTLSWAFITLQFFEVVPHSTATVMYLLMTLGQFTAILPTRVEFGGPDA